KAKDQFEPEPASERVQKSNKLPVDLARHLGVQNSNRRATNKQPGARVNCSNLGIVDLILSVIIAVLLIIVILILVL
ncbi:MAG: hypothetical protein ACREHG_01080, partial [Candidatus Saccharimonadales bacterium]